MKQTAEMIRTCLRLKGMKQKDLAVKLGISKQLVSQKLRQNDDMKFQEVARWLDAIGFSIELKDKSEQEGD